MEGFLLSASLQLLVNRIPMGKTQEKQSEQEERLGTLPGTLRRLGSGTIHIPALAHKDNSYRATSPVYPSQ